MSIHSDTFASAANTNAGSAWKSLTESLLDDPTSAADTVKQTHFDVAVIGGGSAGISAGLEAAQLGLSVVLFDHVDPSPHGTTWDVGGTCVNVGCIPKKLFHSASLALSHKKHAESMGWIEGPNNELQTSTSTESAKMDKTQLCQSVDLNWQSLVESTTQQIHAINFSYRSSLADAGIKLITQHAKIVPPPDNSESDNCVWKVEFKKSENSNEPYNDKKSIEFKSSVTANNVILATGGRPSIPKDIAGASDFVISSDDLFKLKNPPGRTLCIGGGYVSLECAGILTGLGFDVDGKSILAVQIIRCLALSIWMKHDEKSHYF